MADESDPNMLHMTKFAVTLHLLRLVNGLAKELRIEEAMKGTTHEDPRCNIASSCS